MPGGGLHAGETLEEAARRELTDVGATYATSEVSSEMRVDEAGESVELRYFAFDGLPPEINPFNRAVLRRAGMRVD